MGRRPQSAGVSRQDEDLGESPEGVVASDVEAWSRNEGSAHGFGERDWLPAAAARHDVLWRMAEARLGNCVRASGRSGAPPGGGASRLRGDALGASEGGGRAALALHRTERRLAEVRHLVSTPNPGAPEKKQATQSPHGSAVNLVRGNLKTVLGKQLHPNEYNDFAQRSKQYQECNGSVNTGTTPKVQYGYADGSANTIRPTSMTYPNGRILDYLYDDTHADKLSRIRTLHWDDVDVCRYDYLGLNTFVTTDYLQPKVKLDYALGLSPNPYAGFDRFERIVDLLWEKYGENDSSSSSSSGGSNVLVYLLYGYDRSSNRTYRRDEAARSDAKTFDELYEYDRLNQLKKFHRGLLVNENTVIESPGLQQGWQFDATGNWKNFSQFDPADAAKTLDQQRSHNRVNEITEIARTVGTDWTTPTYERNGNTTGDEDGRKFKYDAWNRLAEIRDVENELLATYRYNALGWRVREIRGEAITDLYYSNQWQVLEERVDSVVYTQYGWSLVYIDAMILRDRDSEGNGSLEERLYPIHDANFNIVALLDAGGAVVERFAYDAYGVFSVLTPDWDARGSSTYEWNYLHQGGRWDVEGTVYSFRYREYSPTLGRWIQNDPIGFHGNDFNLYRYNSSNPMIRVDPNGTGDRIWQSLEGNTSDRAGFDRVGRSLRDQLGLPSVASACKKLGSDWEIVAADNSNQSIGDSYQSVTKYLQEVSVGGWRAENSEWFPKKHVVTFEVWAFRFWDAVSLNGNLATGGAIDHCNKDQVDYQLNATVYFEEFNAIERSLGLEIPFNVKGVKFSAGASVSSTSGTTTGMELPIAGSLRAQKGYIYMPTALSSIFSHSSSQ